MSETLHHRAAQIVEHAKAHVENSTIARWTLLRDELEAALASTRTKARAEAFREVVAWLRAEASDCKKQGETWTQGNLTWAANAIERDFLSEGRG